MCRCGKDERRTTNPYAPCHHWRWWPLAHMGAGAIGVTLLRVALGVSDWSVFGLVFGGVQWLMLRRSLRAGGWWVVASTLGGGVGVLLNQAIHSAGPMSSSMIGYAAGGAIYGAALGAAQWVVLRRSVARGSAWWVLANTLAGGVGVVLAVLVNRAWFALLGEGGDGVAAWAVFGLVYGLITGAVLPRQNLLPVVHERR